MSQAALWGVVFVLLLAAIPLATAAIPASSTTYTLTGYVELSSTPAPSGVAVDLISGAAHATYRTTTDSSGAFAFSSASNAPSLAPGSWGLVVPTQANVSLGSPFSPSYCSPCAVLPPTLTPQFTYQSSGNLTSAAHQVTLANIHLIPYTTVINGTISYLGLPARGASIRLLDAQYNNLVLVTNVTNAAGEYSILAPQGTWLLQGSYPAPSTLYNTSQVTVGTATVHRNIVIQSYVLQGYVTTGSPPTRVASSGNLTVFDPANSYVYSTATPGGGFYSFGTYTNLTHGGAQPFDLFLSSVGYQSGWYSQTVANGNAINRNVNVAPLSPAQSATYDTVLNFSAFQPSTGTGPLTVYTNATLGNNSVLSVLPNASVGQLWVQLGLDFNRSISLPSALLPAVASWINSTGAFFPADEAGTAINGTGFSANSNYRFAYSTPCSFAAYCGPTSTSALELNYSAEYSLSSAVTASSPAYTISFTIAHPTHVATYNYRVVLPAGYVLAAGTSAPADTQLAANGPGHTWTSFTVTSLPSASSYTSVTLPIVKFGSVRPIVNITQPSNFAFSSANILNGSASGYTASVALGQSVQFSALNSLYPSGTNGTSFSWNFGDGSYLNGSSTPLGSHTYTTATTNRPYTGTLAVVNSGGRTATASFTVWVTPARNAKAVITTNATLNQTRSAGGVTYLQLHSGATLYFNATKSTANATDPAVPGVLSVALWTVTANNYRVTQNYSVSRGAYFGTNYTVPGGFTGAGKYLNSTVINGVTVRFLGWQYFVNLTIWDGSANSATSSLIVLVNDTQKPLSKFDLLNAQGQSISGRSVIEAANQSAKVVLNAASASDPNNGSIVQFLWNITNPGNASVLPRIVYQNATAPSYAYPGQTPVWLSPQSTFYTVNLTVVDRAGNLAWSLQKVTVAVNTTLRPIMEANNLTGPTSLTAGSSATYWVNVSTGGGTAAIGRNVTVTFYLLAPSGSGARNVIANPLSVLFYNYTNGVVQPTPAYTGVDPAIPYGTTVRALIAWSPGPIGNWILYANISAQNEWPPNYVNGPQTASMAISVNQNASSLTLIYIGIAAAAVVVILLAFYFYRRKAKGTTRPVTGRPGLERGSGRRDPASKDKDAAN